MTWKELTYMVLDELKLISDDSFFTEEHVVFTLNKHRALLLKQEYTGIKKSIPESNYQSVYLQLQQVDIYKNDCCQEVYFKSKSTIPSVIGETNAHFYLKDDYLNSINISYISKNRLRFVGTNKYLSNIIYVSNIDNYIYVKPNNVDFNLGGIYMQAVFEDAIRAAELQETEICDIMEEQFPMEVALIPTLLEVTMKELAGPSWRPYDDLNNANDDLSKLASFLARNAKSNLQKAIDNE